MPKHEFFVDMTCEGCSNAVTRVLHRLGGVQFDIDLPNKKVYIDSEHNIDTLLETLKKTGKNASYLGEKSAQQRSVSVENNEVEGVGCPVCMCCSLVSMGLVDCLKCLQKLTITANPNNVDELKHDFSKKMA